MGTQESARGVGGEPAVKRGVMAVAVSATVLSILPSFLIGTLAVDIRSEFDFGEARLGALITSYLVISAVLSAPMGRLVERIGAAGGIRISAGTGTVAMFGIALLSDSYLSLAAFLVVGGLGQAAVHPAANLALVRRVAAHRQGAAFGVKQSAIPSAAFLGGIAVPVAGTVLGWRGVFLLCGIASLIVMLLAGRAATRNDGTRKQKVGPLRMGPLLLLAAGVAVAVGAVQPLAGFYVSFAAEQGVTPSVAGSLLAAASIANIVVRISSATLTGQREAHTLLALSTLFIVIGASGAWLLAFPAAFWAIAVGVLIAMSVGWGWNAMFQFAVVKANPEAPAAASSITQSGLLMGAALGPLLFGAVVEWWSYAHAWAGAGTCMLVGAAVVFASSRMFKSAA